MFPQRPCGVAWNRFVAYKAHFSALLTSSAMSSTLVLSFNFWAAIFRFSLHAGQAESNNSAPMLFISEALSRDGYFDPKYNNIDIFYELREKFNNETMGYRRAALFVYLNRHAFNGLCRYNSSGGFNTPYGKYKKPYFPGKEMLFFHEKAQKCTFMFQDFNKTIASCTEDDVIYNDPPYVPLSKTSSFVSYNLDGFTDGQHKQLARLGEESKGLFLISNHDTEFTRRLYCNADKLITKQINRSISGKAEGRKQVTEILVIYNKRKGDN